jgi:RNA polymerase sigma factor (sigma-70 family)
MDVLDEARFAQLSERHRRELQVHSYRMLGNLEQAEDAVQEGLLRAWKSRASFAGTADAGTADAGTAEDTAGGATAPRDPVPGGRAWLYRIVTNTCFDMLRAAGRQAERLESIADVPWLQPCPDTLLNEAEAAGPEGAAIRRETVELAYLALIQLLPARQRAVLLLRDVQGYSAAQTAAILGLSAAAVTSALQRARATVAGRWPRGTPTGHPTGSPRPTGPCSPSSSMRTSGRIRSRRWQRSATTSGSRCRPTRACSPAGRRWPAW